MCVDEVPEATREDGTTECARDVVDLGEWRRRRDTLCHQLGGDVVRLECFAGTAGEERSAQRVATGLRDDVHHKTGCFVFSERARCRQRDLLRLPDIEAVAARRITARRTTDVQPIEEESPFSGATTVNGKCGRRRPGHRVVARGDHTRDQHYECVVAASGRNRADNLVAERELTLRTVNVERRCFCGNCDRVAERSDLECRIDGGRERSRELDAVSLNLTQPCVRKPHAVGSRPQVLEAVSAVAVADGRTEFFYELRAGDLDDDACDRGA